MPWFNVDDGFADHPKTIRVGNAAVGLWTRAGSWCAKQLTDGFVPMEIATLYGTPSQARRLVSAGLWREVEGGFQFHDWEKEGRNPTRKEVEKKRRAEAERKQRWREANAAKSGETQVGEGGPGGTQASVPPSVPRVSHPSPPLHSTPLKEEKKTTSSSSRAKRGQRIPDDFTVSSEMVEWARAKVPHVDGRRETEKFINYWQAASGQKAVKRDWPATWRNWMLTAAERLPSGRAAPVKNATDAHFADLLSRKRPEDPPPLELLPGGA